MTYGAYAMEGAHSVVPLTHGNTVACSQFLCGPHSFTFVLASYEQAKKSSTECDGGRCK